MSISNLAGPAYAAYHSLTPAQITLIQNLPKAELHAHLNGCIPITTLQEIAKERLTAQSSMDPVFSDAVKAGIERLQSAFELKELHDFFGLFPAIYALTSNPSALARAARAVLSQFLDPTPEGPAQAAYMELRSTPRETPAMTRLQYIQTVLDEVEQYPPERAALIVSVDRRMTEEVARECVECAIKLRKEGRRVVAIDLCGDPLAGNMGAMKKHFRLAKEAGLGVTLHIAEARTITFTPCILCYTVSFLPQTKENTLDDTLKLLSFAPDRLGHATFLKETEKDFVRNSKICVEICLSSNLLCKTVDTIEEHHIRHYLNYDHPVCICTDDTLPFKNTLVGEYALLMAAAPLGLGMSEVEVTRVAEMGMSSRFKLPLLN
ncbi:hypothetical protein EUX98_g2612 [Antrodiella citrinella]|uniref:Adenosine deaminase domain-containing protein n=1 Tax=Antrodiella citrinella TaxID=2447956 RepID=A0A4S4MYJ2_9APHY|nr:hypothetical protein EUX98_g2612 [Antrodiella citrinella]